MRTTKHQLDVMAKNCNRLCPFKDGSKYEIEYAYGRPRLVKIINGSNGCYANISPRLPKSQLAQWIWAYQAGIIAAQENLK